MKILLSKMREKLYLKFEAKLLVLLMHAMSCLGVHVFTSFRKSILCIHKQLTINIEIMFFTIYVSTDDILIHYIDSIEFLPMILKKKHT